jgi:antitoxin (DNA-binding transcriptional repressor) of toxin-antitoxin stability system
MKRVAVEQLADHLVEYLRLVKRGETVEITEHSVPIARIEPTRQRTHAPDDPLARLVHQGIVTSPSRPLDVSNLRRPIACDADVVGALLDDRDTR